MRKRFGIAAAAAVALGVFPMATAGAQTISCTVLLVYTDEPAVGAWAPHPCGCGRSLEITPFSGGYQITIRPGCPA